MLITGGAGFIGSTARASPRRREHRDRGRQPAPRRALGHGAGRAPELRVPPDRRHGRGRDSRARAGRHAHRPLRRDRRRRHRPREPRPDDAREHDRHLQRARGGARDEGHARAPGRVLDERGLRHPCDQRARGPRHDDRLRRRGALDIRRLEARRRAHGPRLPRRAAAARGDGAAVQRLRPGPGRRRRDQGLHRGRARRPRPDHPRRRRADPRLVLRRRHGPRRAASASSTRPRSARASTSATRARR